MVLDCSIHQWSNCEISHPCTSKHIRQYHASFLHPRLLLVKTSLSFRQSATKTLQNLLQMPLQCNPHPSENQQEKPKIQCETLKPRQEQKPEQAHSLTHAPKLKSLSSNNPRKPTTTSPAENSHSNSGFPHMNMKISTLVPPLARTCTFAPTWHSKAKCTPAPKQLNST